MNFHGDDVVPAAPDQALFHIHPVPMESSVSYGAGTAAGPAAILAASAQLETLTLGSVPAEEGLYTASAIDCSGAAPVVLERIAAAVESSVTMGALPVLLGGEHSLSAGVIEPLQRRYGSFGVVQFDAHADLRNAYEGNPHSHASVMRRFHEAGVPLFQLGTRSYCLEEEAYRRQHEDTIAWLDAEEIARNGCEVRLPDFFPENIYLSFDVDGLDASVMPATGTPVPGGLSWFQAMELLRTVLRQGRCIGFDVVEFAPTAGQHAWDFTAAQLVYNMMALVVQSRACRKA